MIGFGEDLTKENIFKRISSYDIFKFYSNNFIEVGKSFKSDLRPDDENPSCRIDYIKGDLLYTDFGYGSFRAIDYVKEKEGLNYFEALERINSDFNLGLGVNVTSSSKIKKCNIPALSTGLKFSEKKPSDIRKRKRDFTSNDLKYWEDFYWTKEMLELSHTESISHYWINGDMWTVGKDELAFSYEYYWHKDRMMRKLYFPNRKKEFKWISNVDNTIVQLSDVAPKTGDILVVTSSKKDAGIFWRMQIDNMFPGLIIHGVAPNNEGSFLPEDYFHKQQKRWKRIILWYNNDWNKKNNPGVANSVKYSKQFDIEWFTNPDGEPKDPSDFSKEKSLPEFASHFKSVIFA